MANTKQKQTLAKTLYGTQDLNKLDTKQTAIIKALIRDIVSKKQNPKKALR